jgi:hypothetical protein
VLCQQNIRVLGCKTAVLAASQNVYVAHPVEMNKHTPCRKRMLAGSMPSHYLLCAVASECPLHSTHCALLRAAFFADLETAYHTKLTLDWRTGVAATDWDTIAKKEHLDQLSVEMRKVEGAIREIYAEMLQLQQREQEMRDLNGERLV